MDDNIPEFEGGTRSAREKLNRLVAMTNMVAKVRGDEKFISVKHHPGAGITVSLNHDQATSRDPRDTDEMATLYLLIACGTDADTGCARYMASYGRGGVVDLDFDSNAQLPDDSMDFDLTPNCVFVNLFEQGTEAIGTHVLATDFSQENNGAFVTAYLVGKSESSGPDRFYPNDSSGGSYPVYYGSIAPLCTLFRVALTALPMSPGDSGGRRYNVFTETNDFPMPLGTAMLPEFRPYRFSGSGEAQEGIGFLNIVGEFVLSMAFENPQGLLFLVNTAKNQGSGGNKFAPANFTYDVTSLYGVPLGNDLPVYRPRPFGKRSAGTQGYGIYTQFGAFELVEAFEVDVTKICNSGDSGG